MESVLTADTQAVLLLCGALGSRDSNGLKPLGAKQFNTVSTWLAAQGMRFGDLLETPGRKQLAALQSAEIDAGRLASLLDRGAALGLVVEKWIRSGLWVVSRSDAEYPERLRTYLGKAAPPLLYGVGSKELLGRGGLAVVGSRDRSDEEAAFARSVAEQCAREEILIVSGAAKGIDRDAMEASLEANGWSLGVLAEGLAKTASSAYFRAGLMNERLTLISPYEPDSRWLAYTAMERNKLIYGLSDAALVVTSADEEGGTWSGATEALSNGGRTIFIRAGSGIPPGNAKLLKRGGTPFPESPWIDLQEMLKAHETGRPDLFNTQPAVAVKEAVSQPSQEATMDAYSLIRDTLMNLLSEPRTEDWLAESMQVRGAQMKDWLEKAIEDGRVKKLKRPVRYVAQPPGLF